MSEPVFQHVDEVQTRRATLSRDRIFGARPAVARVAARHLGRYSNSSPELVPALWRKQNAAGGYYWLRAWSARTEVAGRPRYVTYWMDGRALAAVESDDRELDPYAEV